AGRRAGRRGVWPRPRGWRERTSAERAGARGDARRRRAVARGARPVPGLRVRARRHHAAHRSRSTRRAPGPGARGRQRVVARVRVDDRRHARGRRGRSGAARLTAARLLVGDAAGTLARDGHAAARRARSFAVDAAIGVTLESMRIHGGYGYTTEFAVERYYRDAAALLTAPARATG